MICDLAETYSIYDYQSMPLYTVAIFVCGLRDNSRVKMKISDMKIDTDRLLLAYAVDNLMYLSWTKTEDAMNGINRPTRISNILLGKEEIREIEAFNSAEEFERAWRE